MLMFLEYVVKDFVTVSSIDSSITQMSEPLKNLLAHLGFLSVLKITRFVNNLSPTIFLSKTSSDKTCELKFIIEHGSFTHLYF